MPVCLCVLFEFRMPLPWPEATSGSIRQSRDSKPYSFWRVGENGWKGIDVLLAVLGRCCLPGKTQKYLHVLLGRALWESFVDFLGCRFRHHLRTCTNFVKALRFMRAIVGCAFSQGYQSK